ncbi:hypothetical protein AOL_s00169g259 [Orbilia oligospora ATCC 24927]|uniref:Copper acquisition factor BIM1-like domain-containing protein n=1 Tax=Arthrobotrys oligospora (strain ATCC 24927 / CBS 115.81 / DSM 1491) TaxID=756982 RepID=G1XN56_ARTOA|nr:hypothetical protein AOL_s00169g259 [Orbilia oligospora ATCC 24927]EGX45653.1 hypothetical protein AOL_s00169g259 [Orbilia oligospora ATCC 24927]
MLSKLIAIASISSLARAHYFLQSPPSIGFDDVKLTETPCGGFDATDRSGGVTEWPVSGFPFSVITTHLDVIWTFKAALLSDVSNFIDIYPNVRQTGISEFCLPALPGIEAWIGQDAVFQVVQQAPDGYLYQCSAIKFVSGGPALTGDCSNSTSVRASIIPGTGPRPPVQSSSTTTRRFTTTSISSTTSTIPDPEPTEDPNTESSTTPVTTADSSTRAHEETTTTVEPTSMPTEGPTTVPTTHHSNDHTDIPTYAPTPSGSGSPTISMNSTTTLPTVPPAYTGTASTGKSISFLAIFIAVAVCLL